MCGIVGKVHADRERPVERASLESMMHCVSHRGPDETGIYLENNCGFGHQRLSIIDLSTGRQPLSNEDGTLWIIFNGEIYNFRELHDQLVKQGHVFKTKSDTETILHLYEEQGERCVDSLRGMFAFAIWNETNQELFLARDRVGKKPLYYAASNGSLAFASEMKSLLNDPQIGRDLDFQSLDEYLTLQYIPAPRSIFKSIRKLPPAHWLRWRAGDIRIERYWNLDYEPKSSISETEACERIRMQLDEAVRLRLESEVPLGCLLSGGIDSSAVVAFMRRHFAGSLKTFSIGFEEQTHNELPYAKLIADKFSTDHEELIVKPNAVDVLPRLVWHFDEPYADPSGLPTFYVSELTRRKVTVVLTGDGGDESFAGYERYRGIPVIEKYKRIPAVLRKYLIGPLEKSGRKIAPNAIMLERLCHLNNLSLMSEDRQYAQYMTIFRDSQKRQLYGETWAGVLKSDGIQTLIDAYNRLDVREDVDRKMHADISTYLPGDLLVKMDRMSMAHGLEARSPFLDHHIMEFAARLPSSLKFKNKQLKYLLKKALEPVLPHEILYRPKQGFAVPLEGWFRGNLKNLVREILLSDAARQRGFFDHKYVAQLVEEHISGKRNHQHRVWSLLCFEIWCRTFLDRSDGHSGPIKL